MGAGCCRVLAPTRWPSWSPPACCSSSRSPWRSSSSSPSSTSATTGTCRLAADTTTKRHSISFMQLFVCLLVFIVFPIFLFLFYFPGRCLYPGIFYFPFQRVSNDLSVHLLQRSADNTIKGVSGLDVSWIEMFKWIFLIDVPNVP